MGWDNAYRSLWRTLEKLDSVRTDRFCWTYGVKSLQRLTAKFKGGKKVGTLSYDTIQKLLVEFRGEGLVSLEFQNEEGDYRGVFGFYVAGQDVHDALCERKGRTCRFIGWNKLTPTIKPDGQPHPDSLCSANEKDLSDSRNIPGMIPERSSLALAGIKPGLTTQITTEVPTMVPTLLEKVPRVVPTLVPRVVPTLLGKSADNSADTKAPQEAQNDKVAPMAEKFGLRFGAPNHGIMESSQSLEAINQSSESASHVQIENQKAGLSPSLSRPDLTKTHTEDSSAPASPRTPESEISVGTHIGKPVTIEQV